MAAYMYPISLAALSGLMIALERFFPWRPEQKQLRPKLWSDVIHLVFNGHFVGLLLAGLASTWILPYFDRWLAVEGLTDSVYRNAALDWPLWVQVIVALVVLDFIQWCVHNLLHRIPIFWELHKTHHSVVGGDRLQVDSLSADGVLRVPLGSAHVPRHFRHADRPPQPRKPRPRARAVALHPQ
ncbi:MAG: sterol desaturase family protein [Deltaproteobacteria bacterium]|nr:sterol desaturase family protein [Deltaproteobacteria bacterium]